MLIHLVVFVEVMHDLDYAGTGGRGGMRRTCGTTAAAGRAKAAKAAKVHQHDCFAQ